MKNSLFIGLIGENGSGKTTACDIFKTIGFETVSLSRVVRDYVESKGLKQERNVLIEYANILKQKHGLTYFAETCFNTVSFKQYERVVFDSVRHPDEVSFLKEKGVYFVGLKVPVSVRYERIKKRQHMTDLIDYQTFIEQDKREKSGDSLGQNLDKAFLLCDVIIENSDNLDRFKNQLLDVVSKMEMI